MVCGGLSYSHTPWALAAADVLAGLFLLQCFSVTHLLLLVSGLALLLVSVTVLSLRGAWWPNIWCLWHARGSKISHHSRLRLRLGALQSSLHWNCHWKCVTCRGLRHS